MTESQPTLRVTEIFKSIQGESTRAGLPCAFVRLTGCSLRCVWCDTAYAFHGGGPVPVSDAVDRVLAMGTDLVEVTGGEPLEQEAVYPLLDLLLEAKKTVLLETGGHVPLDRVDSRVVKIVDVKAPGSGMQHANLTENLDLVTTTSAVAASIGNIGPGLGDVGPLGNYAGLPGLVKWLLSGLMIVGRLEIFPVLVLFTRDLWRR